MIKALACDIDGTITDKRRRIDLGAVALLREIETEGIPVLLASGNIMCMMDAASLFIGTTGPLIAENGGIVKNKQTQKKHYTSAIANIEITKAFEHLQNVLPVRLVNSSELRETEIAIYKDFEKSIVVDELKAFNVRVVDTKFAIHILDPNVNKGVGLSVAADIMGLSLDEFASVGDSENDIEMLESSGLAIGVGDERLRDSVDFITRASYAEGGIEALEHVLNTIREERS